MGDSFRRAFVKVVLTDALLAHDDYNQQTPGVTPGSPS